MLSERNEIVILSKPTAGPATTRWTGFWRLNSATMVERGTSSYSRTCGRQASRASISAAVTGVTFGENMVCVSDTAAFWPALTRAELSEVAAEIKEAAVLSTRTLPSVTRTSTKAGSNRTSKTVPTARTSTAPTLTTKGREGVLATIKS